VRLARVLAALILFVASVLIGMVSVGCGDNWPRAIKIGVDVGRDAGSACVEVDGDEIREVPCPDGGGDR
jgi:hypothetical protein